jgi:hypothetical protein
LPASGGVGRPGVLLFGGVLLPGIRIIPSLFVGFCVLQVPLEFPLEELPHETTRKRELAKIPLEISFITTPDSVD